MKCNNKTDQASDHENIASQPKIFDILNSYEIYFIKFCQKIFRIPKYISFHKKIQAIGSIRIISLTPLLLFCLGQPDSARELSQCLVYYSIISTLCQFICYRRRPSSYSDILCFDPYSSSSFPSHHSIVSAVLSSYIPWFPARLIFKSIVFINQCLLGCHFPSDILIGFCIGDLVFFLSNKLSLQILVLICLGVSQFYFPVTTQLNGALLPFLILKCDGSSYISFWVPLLKLPITDFIRRKFNIQQTGLFSFLLEFFTITILMFFAASFSLYINQNVMITKSEPSNLTEIYDE